MCLAGNYYEWTLISPLCPLCHINSLRLCHRFEQDLFFSLGGGGLTCSDHCVRPWLQGGRSTDPDMSPVPPREPGRGPGGGGGGGGGGVRHQRRYTLHQSVSFQNNVNVTYNMYLLAMYWSPLYVKRPYKFGQDCLDIQYMYIIYNTIICIYRYIESQ